MFLNMLRTLFQMYINVVRHASKIAGRFQARKHQSWLNKLAAAALILLRRCSAGIPFFSFFGVSFGEKLMPHSAVNYQGFPPLSAATLCCGLCAPCAAIPAEESP